MPEPIGLGEAANEGCGDDTLRALRFVGPLVEPGYEEIHVAEQIAGMRLVKRSEWGARYGRGPTNITPSQGGVTVHYEGGGRLTGRLHSACAGRVRAIEAYHVRTNGWSGIAYSYLACEHGYVFEGRGLGHRTAANGTTSGNQNWYAVCALIGDLDPAGDALLTALRDAIDHMRSNDAGPRINGHRDHLSTSCPGDRLYDWVRRGAPRPVSKPVPKPTTPQEDDVRYGLLIDGEKAVTPISVHPGDISAIGFFADNGLAGLPPAKLRLAAHTQDRGWRLIAAEFEVDGSKDKPWFELPEKTDGLSVARLDDGKVPVAWDAS